VKLKDFKISAHRDIIKAARRADMNYVMAYYSPDDLVVGATWQLAAVSYWPIEFQDSKVQAFPIGIIE
jgi:ketosteroid isomerase-like protein